MTTRLIKAAYLRFVFSDGFMKECREVWITSACREGSHICQNRFHATNRRVLRDQPEHNEQRRCFATNVTGFLGETSCGLHPDESLLNESGLSRYKSEN